MIQPLDELSTAEGKKSASLHSNREASRALTRAGRLLHTHIIRPAL